MIELDYKHVLFKDLKGYLRKQDYLGGFTPVQQAFIRKNLGAASQEDLNKFCKGTTLSYSKLVALIQENSLTPGAVYIINDFQTIYSSNELNEEGKLISYGQDVNPSPIYKIAAIAITQNQLLSTVSILSEDPDSIYWSAQYDVTQETLDDGTFTKGKITYLLDNNFNSAQFDFKNILLKQNGILYHTFSNSDGSDNSNNCYNNNLCFASNVVLIGNCSNNVLYGNDIRFDVPVNNLHGELNNIHVINDEIGLNNETLKQTIIFNENYHIDYLDLETLTHQFYALSDNTHNTL